LCVALQLADEVRELRNIFGDEFADSFDRWWSQRRTREGRDQLFVLLKDLIRAPEQERRLQRAASILFDVNVGRRTIDIDIDTSTKEQGLASADIDGEDISLERMNKRKDREPMFSPSEHYRFFRTVAVLCMHVACETGFMESSSNPRAQRVACELLYDVYRLCDWNNIAAFRLAKRTDREQRLAKFEFARRLRVQRRKEYYAQSKNPMHDDIDGESDSDSEADDGEVNAGADTPSK
jgi:hypothetical protein